VCRVGRRRSSPAMSGSGIHAATGRSKWAETRRRRPSPWSPAVRGHGCCFFAGGGILDGPGDASRGTSAEPYRVGVLLRSSVLRPTDASPLRVPGSGRRLWIQRAGRCLSCDERRAVSCGCAFAIVCAAADGCIAPTGAGFGA